MTTREDEIRARFEKATPGPWFFDGHKIIERKIDADGFMEVICNLPSGRKSDRNADLLTYAPADICYLLKENQRLRGALEIYADTDNWNGSQVMGFYEFDSAYDATELHEFDEKPWEIARQALRPKEEV